jgi:hypothetical protein
MATGSETREVEINRLYGLPLDQFTAARDELAKRLRGEGERGAADDVKRLRKPSLAAWALNQVRRNDPRRVDELIAAGERLRNAQERLLATGERGLLRDAAAEERRLAQELVRLGEGQLRDAGHPVSATVQSKLWATVHAVAGDQEARELLAAGRLLRDHETSDLGLLAAGPGVVRPPKAPTAKPPKAPTAKPPKAGAAKTRGAPTSVRRAAERKMQDLERRLDRARKRKQDIDKKLHEAGQRVTDARREAARVASELERAEASAEGANERAREAAEGVLELEAALRELALTSQ